MITRKLGLQLLGVFHKTQLHGTDNSYYSYLEYTAIFWPGNNPTLVTREYDEVESIMNPRPLEINPSFFILDAGFKLRF